MKNPSVKDQLWKECIDAIGIKPMAELLMRPLDLGFYLLSNISFIKPRLIGHLVRGPLQCLDAKHSSYANGFLSEGPCIRAVDLPALFCSWDFAYRWSKAGWLKPVMRVKWRTSTILKMCLPVSSGWRQPN